jgi:cobalt/nickel transport protein
MKRPIRSAMALAWLLVAAGAVSAHYNMLLPEAASVKRGEAVALIYQWGHPFEHQLFDAPAPQELFVIAPDGKKTDLTKNLERVTAATTDAKNVVAYRLRFTPEQRGDYVFVLNRATIWMEEEQQFFQDAVKVVLHVQAQKGWDAVADLPFEIVPLTRPYGLQPGMVFQAQVRSRPSPPGGQVLAGGLVEIERYNPAAPKILPPDEQITRTAKTDSNGVVTCTLTEPGWWCITAQRDGGKQERDGKAYPVKQRASHWVFVDDQIISK